MAVLGTGLRDVGALCCSPPCDDMWLAIVRLCQNPHPLPSSGWWLGLGCFGWGKGEGEKRRVLKEAPSRLPCLVFSLVYFEFTSPFDDLR